MAILGLGIGKMELRLNKTQFYPEEVIEGSAMLTLNEQINARGVLATFWAERQTRRGKSTYTDVLYKREERLDTERLYNSSGGAKNYSFKFTVPRGILAENQFGSDLIGGAMSFLRDMGNNSIRWYVSVKLDIPMGFDVSKKQQINVNPGRQMQPRLQ